MFCQFADGFVLFGDDGDDTSFPGFDLLDIADDLFVGTAVGGQHHHGHVLVYQGYGTVLHLGRRVTLGMDVGDLLEFQGAFQGNRKIIATTQVEEMGHVFELFTQLPDEGLGGEYVGHFIGDGTQLYRQMLVLALRYRSLLAGNAQGHQGEYCHLRREGFGGGLREVDQNYIQKMIF